MQLRYAKHLEGLSLQNINSKLQSLRDQLRDQTNQDAQFIRYKMTTSLADEASEYHQDRIPSGSEDPANMDTLNQPLNTTGLPIYTKTQQQLQKELGISLSQPVSYKNLKLVDREIDYDEVKRLNNKKISVDYERQYIKEVLPADACDKMREIWDEIEDDQCEVTLKNFVKRFNKLGIKFTEAVAFHIPIIKKNVILKKVLFELGYKYENLPQKCKWEEFRQIFSHFYHLGEPSMDILVKKLKKEEAWLPSNFFHVPDEVISELKSIYKKCSADHFLGYSSSAALVSKMQSSMMLERYSSVDVRPKTHLQVAVSLKDTINYMKRKAPLFVDLDDFLLYFSAKPLAYYPLEEKECLDNDQTLNLPKHRHTMNRIKSAKEITVQKSASPKTNIKNQYMMSFHVPRCAQKEKQEIIQEQGEIKQAYKFKARPYSKTKSEEKYQQFIESLNSKRKELREKEEQKHKKSEKQIERLKSETKLFVLPQHSPPKLKTQRFTSRPAPEVCLSPRLQDIQSQKEERKKKIMSLTNQKYRFSWQELPNVATVQKQSPPKQDNLHLNEYYKQSHDVPDYKPEQQRMKLELQLKKAHFKPTQFKEFYFHTQARHPHQYKQNEVELNYGEPSYDYKKILYSPQPDIYYTQKFTDMVVSNKNQAYKKQLDLNKKMKEQQQRQIKHKNFAKFMKGPLAKIPNTAKICELQAKTKIERHNKYWKNLDHEYEQGLNEIYSKVIKRPFLYEVQSGYQKPKGVELPKYEHPQKKKTNKKKANKIMTPTEDVNKSF